MHIKCVSIQFTTTIDERYMFLLEQSNKLVRNNIQNNQIEKSTANSLNILSSLVFKIQHIGKENYIKRDIEHTT